MDWQGLSRKMLAEHQHSPQILGRLELALSQAREALQIMAGHGFQFHLAEGPGPKHPDWPKKLFHVDRAPNGILVYCEADALELGPGWFDSLSKAQFWDGLETQFNGRGGVPKSPKVPAPIFALQTSSDPQEIENQRAFIAAFRALNKWEKPNALELTQAEENNASRETQSGVQEENGDSAGSREGIRGGGSEGEVSEAEKFQEQIRDFGKQERSISIIPPSLASRVQDNPGNGAGDRNTPR